MEKLILSKKVRILVFILVLLLIILIILTMKIKVEFKNIKITTLGKKHINRDYEIKLIIFIFQKIPIFKMNINNEKVKKTIKNEKIMNKIKQQEVKIIENTKKFNKEFIKTLKNINLKIKEINLKILIGTENASLTAFIIPVVSTVIAMIIRKHIKKYNEKQQFLVLPIYLNQNLINVECSGIFEIKMIHIINTICIVNKKRKGDKNERTSNRRSYDYSYE